MDRELFVENHEKEKGLAQEHVKVQVKEQQKAEMESLSAEMEERKEQKVRTD